MQSLCLNSSELTAIVVICDFNMMMYKSKIYNIADTTHKQNSIKNIYNNRQYYDTNIIKNSKYQSNINYLDLLQERFCLSLS